jgi:hypothetical protein
MMTLLAILVLGLTMRVSSASSSLPLHLTPVGHLPPRGIDLWIVGAGTLGELIAKEWRKEYPSASIIAETLSPQRHQLLRSLGAQPILRSERYNASLLALTPPPLHEELSIQETVREMLLFASLHHTRRTRTMDIWKKSSNLFISSTTPSRILLVLAGCVC